MKKFLIVVMAVTAFTGNFSVGKSAVLLSDAFNTDGALLGTTPQIGGVWTATGTTPSVINPLTVTGGVLPIANTGADAFSTFSSALTPVDGNSIFSSMTLNVSAAQAAGDYFFHYTNPGTAAATAFYNRLLVQQSGAGFVLGIQSISGTGSAATYGTSVLSLGTNYNVVTAWDFVAGATNDTFAVYVDPVGSTRPVASYVSAAWLSATAEPLALAAGGLRQGTASSSPTLTTDNLIVATTFAEVVAVPEPSTIALLAVAGVCGVVGVRRRQQKASAV